MPDTKLDMSEPPSYDDIVSECNTKTVLWDSDSKVPHTLSIREEVGVSRAQHVAVLVSKLLPQIRERAKSGLSKTTLLIIPSDQFASHKGGELVGWSEDDRPLLVQLEGRYDGTQFWTQQEALDLLRDHVLSAVAGDMPKPFIQRTLPERPPPQAKTSLFGRKPGKSTELPKPAPVLQQLPAVVDVQLDQVNFRRENEYGLFETTRGRAVVMMIDVR